MPVNKQAPEDIPRNSQDTVVDNIAPDSQGALPSGTWTVEVDLAPLPVAVPLVVELEP